MVKHRSLGIATMVLGVVILFAPIVIGRSIIALLGLVFFAAGLIQFGLVLWSEDRFASFIPYFSGGVCVLLGCVLFLSPTMALSAVIYILIVTFLVDGTFRIYSSFKTTGPDRWWTIFNGAFSVFLAFLVLYLDSAKLGLAAIGIALGLWLMVEGWTMTFTRDRDLDQLDADAVRDPSCHPDIGLGLPPSQFVAAVQQPVLECRRAEPGQNILFCLTFIGLFFAIHLLRTDSEWTFLGLVSPFAAVVGDVIVALLLGIILLLPFRMLWRKVTRPIERIAWNRLESLNESGEQPSLPERAIEYWIRLRLEFALELYDMRLSLNYAFWRLLRFGLPVVAVLIAVNSIWGFSWYFNSENWASAVWQEITKNRVNAWRMRAAEDVEQQAIASGVAAEDVFRLSPPGIDDSSDFSFIVIGDTGEGDQSQIVLSDQIVAVGRQDDVKFLVVSSDVIYPDGKMKDYESKFYLPFKGFEKPIYAIPGNHDWYDADEGFNANFLQADAALTSSRARLLADLKTDALTNDSKFQADIESAQRLREYYKIDNGHQRAPFFEIHTPGFSIVAVDTGILREIDEKQAAWLEAALQRAGKNFKLAILGHPFYVGGRDTAVNDEAFEKVRQILTRHHVDAIMAGDTHDFEFYREPRNDGSGRDTLHFVNGGGGAYLSIGTSVAFPKDPDLSDYAFYPRTDAVNAKLDRETPVWKWPFLYWMRWFGGYPFDSEMVSGAFDFNASPFFQSFVEVRVERSRKQVRFLLYGANGPLRWRDIQVGGSARPAGATDDDQVAFIAPMETP